MEETKKCPKCGGEMEAGKEIAGGTVSSETVWVKTGTILKIGAPKIFSYSCLKCGFVESYTKR